jgi:cysteine-rich repeat protein
VSDTYCGDALVTAPERCDDGNFVDTDDCSVDCELTHCGNGTLDAFEECDDGAANSDAPDAACRRDCRPRRCGDGIADRLSGEECDDGNGTSGDGCTATCGVERPASGHRLLLRDRPAPRKRALVVETRDPALTLGDGNGSLDDPVLHGASLRVLTTDGCGGPCVSAYDLPSGLWTYVGAPGDGRGYRYRDRSGGPIRRGVVKPGGPFRFSGRGALLTHVLAANPEPVHVVLRLGSTTYCLEFGGTTRFDPMKKFEAQFSTPTVCPAD